MTQPTERVEAAARSLLDTVDESESRARWVAELALDAADEADGITFRIMHPELVEVEGFVWCSEVHAPHLSNADCPGPHRPLFTERHVHSFKCESCGATDE